MMPWPMNEDLMTYLSDPARRLEGLREAAEEEKGKIARLEQELAKRRENLAGIKHAIYAMKPINYGHDEPGEHDVAVRARMEAAL